MVLRSDHSKTHRFLEILSLLVLVFRLLSFETGGPEGFGPGVFLLGTAGFLVVLGLVHRPARKVSWVAILVAGLVSTLLRPDAVDGALLCLFAAFLLFDSGWFARRTVLMAGPIGGAILMTQIGALLSGPLLTDAGWVRLAFTDGLLLVLCLVFRRDLFSPSQAPLPTLAMVDFDLSPQERQIVHLVWGGESTKQIAGFLGITDAAVRKSLSRVYAKVGVPGLKERGDLIHTHRIVWEEPSDT